MYGNPYMPQTFNRQEAVDRINANMNELERMKQQLQQPQQTQQPAINQTFQLSSSNNIKYANTLDEVNKEYVINDTPFFTKDFSQMWLKSANGNIKVYTLEEVVPKDDRDLLIESLQMQVAELRKEMNENAKSNNDDVDESNTSKKYTNVSNVRTSTKKSK